jgi:hypothetical protein
MGSGYQIVLPTPTTSPPVAPQAIIPPVPTSAPALDYCVDPGDGHKFCGASQAEADAQAQAYVRSGQMIHNQTAVVPAKP